MTGTRLRAILTALVVVCAGGAQAAMPQGIAPVVCSLDQPIVGRHQNVGAEVFTTQPAGTKLSFHWTATAGTIGPGRADGPVAAGGAVSWASGDATPGTYRISVDVTKNQSEVGACTLGVIVSETQRSASSGAGALPRRHLLERGRHEVAHYGLYSYILFGRRPGDDQGDDMRERFRAILEAYFRSFDEMPQENEKPLEQINMNYVPVDRPAPDHPDPEWVWEHYDYARAEGMVADLRHLAGGCLHDSQGEGPFLVSALQPLEFRGTTRMLCQDLSTVPATAVRFWINKYASQMDQQRVWDGKAIDTLFLRFRTVVAQLAEAMPMATKAVQKCFTMGTAS